MVSEVRGAGTPSVRPSVCYHLVCPVLRSYIFFLSFFLFLPDSGPEHRHIMNYGERLNRMAFCEFCVRRKCSDYCGFALLTKAKAKMTMTDDAVYRSAPPPSLMCICLCCSKRVAAGTKSSMAIAIVTPHVISLLGLPTEVLEFGENVLKNS